MLQARLLLLILDVAIAIAGEKWNKCNADTCPSEEISLVATADSKGASASAIADAAGGDDGEIAKDMKAKIGLKEVSKVHGALEGPLTGAAGFPMGEAPAALLERERKMGNWSFAMHHTVVADRAEDNVVWTPEEYNMISRLNNELRRGGFDDPSLRDTVIQALSEANWKYNDALQAALDKLKLQKGDRATGTSRGAPAQAPARMAPVDPPAPPAPPSMMAAPVMAAPVIQDTQWTDLRFLHRGPQPYIRALRADLPTTLQNKYSDDAARAKLKLGPGLYTTACPESAVLNGDWTKYVWDSGSLSHRNSTDAVAIFAWQARHPPRVGLVGSALWYEKNGTKWSEGSKASEASRYDVLVVPSGNIVTKKCTELPWLQTTFANQKFKSTIAEVPTGYSAALVANGCIGELNWTPRKGSSHVRVLDVKSFAGDEDDEREPDRPRPSLVARLLAWK